ncbi:hypothetical protein QBC39DRAFT_352038 [Podospora conica]|nr:hypothetical protein QBC39DRAFT_352038 [Schizothecium conicum]
MSTTLQHRDGESTAVATTLMLSRGLGMRSPRVETTKYQPIPTLMANELRGKKGVMQKSPDLSAIETDFSLSRDRFLSINPPRCGPREVIDAKLPQPSPCTSTATQRTSKEGEYAPPVAVLPRDEPRTPHSISASPGPPVAMMPARALTSNRCARHYRMVTTGAAQLNNPVSSPKCAPASRCGEYSHILLGRRRRGLSLRPVWLQMSSREAASMHLDGSRVADVVVSNCSRRRSP